MFALFHESSDSCISNVVYSLQLACTAGSIVRQAVYSTCRMST
jgi:hypothetical protein